MLSDLYVSAQKLGLYQAPGYILIGLIVLALAMSWKSKATAATWISLGFCLAWAIGWKDAQDRNKWLASQLTVPPMTEFRYHAGYPDHESWSLKVNPVVAATDLVKFYLQKLPANGWTLVQQGDTNN